MKRYRLFLLWFGRLVLLFFAFVGIATLISNQGNRYNLNTEQIICAWFYGIAGALVVSLLLSTSFRQKKKRFFKLPPRNSRALAKKNIWQEV